MKCATFKMRKVLKPADWKYEKEKNYEIYIEIMKIKNNEKYEHAYNIHNL